MLEGKDKSFNEQIKILKKILFKSKKIKEILKILEEYSNINKDFNNYYLVAGCINQTIFNYYHGYDLDYGIGDYDISFYIEDTSYEAEDVIIKDLEKRLKHLNVIFDIKNQKRVPIWYKEKTGIQREEYTSVENAISRWTSTVTCIGVRLEKNKFIVCAPYGLNDLFSLTIRRGYKDVSDKMFKEKTDKWKSKWPKLIIKSK